jgi:hypothetical protein
LYTKKNCRKPIKTENDRYVKKVKNKTKAMWQLIIEEAGYFPSSYKKIQLKQKQVQ